MSAGAQQLHDRADQQIAELIELVSGLDREMMRRPCVGRERLGDGTAAASAQHTADNYERIAAFIKTSDQMSTTHGPVTPGGHRVPRFMRSLGHRPPAHADHGPAGEHSGQYTAERVQQAALLDQLTTTRKSLLHIAELTDSRLDSIPPDGSFRFCDGKRSLEQVLGGLLNHQEHQVQALKQAVIVHQPDT